MGTGVSDDDEFIRQPWYFEGEQVTRARTLGFVEVEDIARKENLFRQRDDELISTMHVSLTQVPPGRE